LAKEVARRYPTLTRKAEQGDADAQVELGRLYITGEFDPDRVHTSKPMDIFGQMIAGWVTGTDETEDVVKHIQNLLKHDPRNWRWVDAREGYRLFHKAAAQGNVEAQTWLGKLYYYGTPVLQKDVILSFMWFSLADDRLAMEQMVECNEAPVALLMGHAVCISPSHVNEAIALAAKCKNSGYQDCGYKYRTNLVPWKPQEEEMINLGFLIWE